MKEQKQKSLIKWTFFRYGCMKQLMIGLIKLYRKYISPLKRYPSCRYVPTCSLYAIQALEKYGLLKGSFLAVKRILRCHPFAKGGDDPVP